MSKAKPLQLNPIPLATFSNVSQDKFAFNTCPLCWLNTI